MILVYLLTAVIITAWLVKMILARRLIFRRTFWDWPLLVFLLSQFLSFLFSIDRHTSLWGYYSRFHGGLLSTLCYLLLYWAYVSNLDQRQSLLVIKSLLSAAVLVAVYGILEHFGIDAQYWVQDVKTRVFSTLGQPNWLAAYLAALIPLTWALTLSSKNKKRKLFFFLFLLFYLCLLYTKSRSGLLGFAASWLGFWPLALWGQRRQGKKVLKPFLILTAIFLISSLLIGTPWTPSAGKMLRRLRPATPTASQNKGSQNNQPPPLITESGEIRKIVWRGALRVWRHWPVFGSGVETFAYSYYRFRPREHNDVSEWNFLYNKAHNEYLNFAATTGTVGLLSYLAIIVVFVFWSLRKIKPAAGAHADLDTLPLALFSGFLSILVTNFFGFSVVPVALFFFLFPAIAVVLVQAEKEEKKKREKTITINSRQALALVFLGGSLLFLFYSLAKFWSADVFFAKGNKLNKAKQYEQAFNYLQQAIKLRPREPFYHDELALAAAGLAKAAFQQKQIQLAQKLAELAIAESDQALKTSPYHLNFWKNRTRVFYSLAELDSRYYQAALAALLRATELAPTEAKVSYNLGLMYLQLGQDELAIKTLEKTTELKPNYEEARYALALLYEQKGEIGKAKEQLEYLVEKINPYSRSAIEKLKELEKK